ncbi:DUF1254 domain-containing protein [Flammeovirga sp. MY04]|uniref:DUF1254 domain-containing protein n=1 Tax=Flammeovirga sp. MY04 TaxID=1191459 RepID=UPI000A036FC8|nr:DUF1214 domain-containing protein [Flammeovirga sp. MY04]ANQ52531.2 DUF1254 domain-containing protein [Flammeovirga sp. MY04]
MMIIIDMKKNVLQSKIALFILGIFLLGNFSAVAQQNTLNEKEQNEYNFTYNVGVQATIYGWALVMMDVALELQTNVDAPSNNGQAPINQLGPITRLWDYRDRSYTTPNNDTYYIQGWGDLEEQPLVLFVPEVKNRYWIEQILDMYTESVVDLCNATVGDKGGYFILAKKGQEFDNPNNLPVYYSNTRYIWLAGRLGTDGSESDKKIAQDLQTQFRLFPLADYPNGGVQPAPKVVSGAPKVNFPMGLDWYNRFEKALNENYLESDRPITEQFEYIGFGKGGVNTLAPHKREALQAAFKDAFAMIVNAAKYSSTPVNGWNWEYKAGKYGADYLQRSAINMNSIGLNSPERAMYPKRYHDNNGEVLNGKNAYKITLPADMPINYEIGGFWSMTMYDAEDRFMVENNIKRYKVGSMMKDLKYNKDGSLTIYISPEAPKDKKQKKNWLPAPEGDFMLQFRFYEPKIEVVDVQFALPQLYNIN